VSVRYVCDGCGKETTKGLHTFHSCLEHRVYSQVSKRELCLQCAETIERLIRDWQPLSKEMRK